LALLSSVIAQRSENENSGSKNAAVVWPHELTHLVMLCWLMTLPGTMAENRSISGLFKWTVGNERHLQKWWHCTVW